MTSGQLMTGRGPIAFQRSLNAPGRFPVLLPEQVDGRVPAGDAASVLGPRRRRSGINPLPEAAVPTDQWARIRVFSVIWGE